jgi:hypothetical protein
MVSKVLGYFEDFGFFAAKLIKLLNGNAGMRMHVFDALIGQRFSSCIVMGYGFFKNVKYTMFRNVEEKQFFL